MMTDTHASSSSSSATPSPEPGSVASGQTQTRRVVGKVASRRPDHTQAVAWLAVTISSAGISWERNDASAKGVVLALCGLVMGLLLSMAFGPDSVANASKVADRTPGALRIAGRRLTLEGGSDYSIGRDKIESAFVQEEAEGKGALVLRFKNHHQWTIGDLPLAEAHALLSELVPDHMRKPMRLLAFPPAITTSFRSSATTSMALIGLLLLWAGHFASPLGLGFFGWWLTTPIALLGHALWATTAITRIPPEVTLTKDYVQRAWLGRRDRVPLGDIAEVRTMERGVELRCIDGRTHTIALIEPGWESGFAEAAKALAVRIEEARQRHAAAEGALAALERGDRSTHEWVAGLSTLGARGGEYRASDATYHELQAVLADRERPARLRVAAAVSLWASEDPALRLRVEETAREEPDHEIRQALQIIERDPEMSLQMGAKMG